MVSKLRLCRAIQAASASPSATVPIASTNTASYSPKIKVDVIGSKPSASPKGFGRSPTMVFPGAVKTFTLSVFDATGAVTRVVSFIPSVPPLGTPFAVRASDYTRQDWEKRDTESIGRRHHPFQSIGWTLRSGTGITVSQRASLDLESEPSSSS